MILVLVIVIAVVYYSSKGRGLEVSSDKNKNPEELLRQRFAKGEIDEATYLKMKLTLKE